MDTIQRVGVIGAGTMGNGIAQACAVKGIPVVMVDVQEAAVLRGLATIAGSLDRLVKKDKIAAADKEAALGRIKGSTAYADLAGCDLVIEAATENLDLKLRILRDVDKLAKPGTLIASNTSSISITTLAAVTSRPAEFLGVHFFNPVPLMALVELVRGLQTSDATVEAAAVFAQRLGQDADRREEQPRLRRQPHPVPDAQRGGVRAAGRARVGDGDRRRHEARLQPPDRAAGAVPT